MRAGRTHCGWPSQEARGHDSIAEFGDDGSNAVSDIADADYQSEVDARPEQVVIERCTRDLLFFLLFMTFRHVFTTDTVSRG